MVNTLAIANKSTQDVLNFFRNLYHYQLFPTSTCLSFLLLSSLNNGIPTLCITGRNMFFQKGFHKLYLLNSLKKWLIDWRIKLPLKGPNLDGTVISGIRFYCYKQMVYFVKELFCSFNRVLVWTYNWITLSNERTLVILENSSGSNRYLTHVDSPSIA